MKATEAGLLAFLKKSPQFVIPIYQRTYSWTEKECRQLWEDILRAGGDEAISVHFIGSIVYIEEGLSQVSHQAPLLVIDGQQRLTTVTLLLAALACALGESEVIDGFSARKLRNYYLLNPEETGDRHFKLLLSQTDKASLKAVVGPLEMPGERSIRIEQNYELFQSWLAGRHGELTQVCKGLAKVVVVDIALSRDQDNPQLIFESMNSTGRELSQADLIRNFILMGLAHGLQTRLYEQFWRPMEVAFGQEAYNSHFDGFMRHYLTVKTGDIPRLDAVYDAFKGHARTPIVSEAGIEALVRDIRDYARYYCAMALGAEPDPELKRAFQDLRELKVEVSYPFLLELYDDYKAGILPRTDFVEAIRLVEAYVFRRAISTIPPNSLNKTFATFTRALRKHRYLESIKAHFLLQPSYRRFPNDEEFRRELQLRDLYNFRSRTYWLRRFENFKRKERVEIDEYTIEHIMPQNEMLSSAWKAELGADWQRVHQQYLHTLGNLTLTGYNSEYSDRPFIEKRDIEGGFRESPIRLNEGMVAVENWDEDAIRARAQRLALKAPDVWPAPSLPAHVIEAFRNPKSDATSYTIKDHPNLRGGKTRELFDTLRREILALDLCVNEEFSKHWVAFKAETNFVDVIPQAQSVLLIINMKFADISDPRGICRDITNISGWGNGDTEVKLTADADIPYIVGLVRQSLEQQLGSEINR